MATRPANRCKAYDYSSLVQLEPVINQSFQI